MAKNLVSFNDVESRAGINSQTVVGMHSTESNSGWNWTHHAQQWLKGGAAVLGTVVFGGLTYLVGSSSRRNSSLSNDMRSDIDGALISKEDRVTALATAHSAVFNARQLLSLSEADVKNSHTKADALNQQQLNTNSANSLVSQSPIVTRAKADELDLAYPTQKREVHGEFRINTYTINDQALPSVAVLSNGGFIVVWASLLQDGDSYGIYGQRYNSNGIVQGSEFRVNTYTAGYQSFPSVAGLTGGGFAVVWASDGQDGDSFGIYGRRYDSNGIAQGSEFRANTYLTSGDQIYCSVSGLANNNFVVVWTSHTIYAGDEIFHRLYDTAGDPVGSCEGSINSYTLGDQSTNYYKSVATLSNGNFVVVWASPDQDGDSSGIYGQRHDGTKVGGEFRVNTYTVGSQCCASIAALSDGGFVVVWSSFGQDGDNQGAYGQRYDSNGVAQGGEFRVNSQTLDSQGVNSVAGLFSGGFVVVWDSNNQDGDRVGIYGQLYDVNGSLRGGEFRINDYTTHNQFGASVTALSGSDFVVVWDSFGQDGDLGGIYGKTFRAPALVNNSLTVQEGQSFVITPSMISAQDLDTYDTNLMFTITNVQHGQFELVSTAAVITNFTQQQIINNQVRFVHDGGEIAPAFNVTVSDGIFSTDTNAATINFTNVNDAPVLNAATSSALSPITENTTDSGGNSVATIVAAGAITDPDSQIGAIAITEVDNTNGIWQYTTDGTLWKPIAPISDTQSLLLDTSNKVRFVPNVDFNGEATFTFRAWDKSFGVAGAKVDTTTNGGASAFSMTTNVATVNVVPINNPPVLETNKLVINKGQKVVLTAAMLKATDIDDAVDSLKFIISDVKHGKFELVSDSGSAITTFLQKQVVDEAVQFVHDNSEQAPSYKVSVSDGTDATQPMSATIDFQPVTASSRSDIIQNAIIGAGVSGGVGLMFLILKIYLGHKATQKLEKTTQGYKDSVQRKQEEFDKNVLQPIAKKIREQIKITGFMGYISDSTVQDYVDAVVKLVGEIENQGIDVDLQAMKPVERSVMLTEIAHQTRHLLVPEHGMCSCAPVMTFFKPEVKPEDIHKNARNIAKEVKKALTRQDSQVVLKTSVELNVINQRAEEDYATPTNV